MFITQIAEVLYLAPAYIDLAAQKMAPSNLRFAPNSLRRSKSVIDASHALGEHLRRHRVVFEER